VTAIALVEDSGAFVCASQLLRVVADFLATALFACLPNYDARLHIVVVDGLHFRSLCAQGGRKGCGLGLRDDGLGGRVCMHIRSVYVYATALRGRTFACSTTDGASQGHIFLPSATVEEVAAVVAEDEGADCGHGGRFDCRCEM
jgi:hypothetical protein